ncbi:hypothetical protein [Mesorhizobium sp. 1B3]|uniref:hypothetical protein n=1 Tax=Mesorhizobium sp. 1B3 TaxID=3243599 RepID=UPI003D951641
MTTDSPSLREANTGLVGRLSSHAWQALPPLTLAVVGAIVWAGIMAGNAALGVWLRHWETGSKILSIAGLFAAGGALGFPLGLFRLASANKRPDTAFAAAFLGFSIATIGITAALFALIYRSYYAAWHDEIFSLRWFFQFGFTMLGALGQFAVLGLRLYFPFGFVALFLVSLWFARKPR